MGEQVNLPVGVPIRDDVEYRPDRAKPYKARVRWAERSTKRRPSTSESFDTEDEANDWITRRQSGSIAMRCTEHGVLAPSPLSAESLGEERERDVHGEVQGSVAVDAGHRTDVGTMMLWVLAAYVVFVLGVGSGAAFVALLVPEDEPDPAGPGSAFSR